MKINTIALIFVFAGLVILGQYSPKIGLALAAVIFLGSLVFNSVNLEKILNGGALK